MVNKQIDVRGSEKVRNFTYRVAVVGGIRREGVYCCSRIVHQSALLCIPLAVIRHVSLTFAITGVQKQSEAALLHVRVDGVVRHELFTLNGQVVWRGRHAVSGL
jgi:hypothetical protein